MKKIYRIKKTQEIEKILQKRKSSGNKYFIIYTTKDFEAKNFRYALSVSKKLGNAVVRNKEKRQIRKVMHDLQNNIDIVNIFIIERKEALTLSYLEKKQQIEKLIKNHNIWIKEK